MKRIFITAVAVAAIALAGAIPARATTFPVLTTIYVASGAVDNTATPLSGIATVISCSNLSNQTASVRYLFRYDNGAIAAGGTLLLASLAARAVTSQGGVGFFNSTNLPTGSFLGGTLQVLSTQSATYCSAMLVRAHTDEGPAGVALHMVRFNPHPGTVE